MLHFAILCCISASVVSVRNSLEISTCFMWRLLTWSRLASVAQCHDYEKPAQKKDRLGKDGEYSYVYSVCLQAEDLLTCPAANLANGHAHLINISIT